MKILLVSATMQEIQPVLDKFNHFNKKSDVLYSAVHENHTIDILVTGVGMVPTAYHVCKQLSSTKYDLAINAGIAGSFKEIFSVGSVLHVVEDNFSELGLELNNEVVEFKNMNIVQKVENENFYTDTLADVLPVVRGITVNTVHTNKKTIDKIIAKFNPDIETMESASFLFACQAEKIKCLQIRSVSNFVKEREGAEWNSALAIKNLNDFLIVFFNTL